jgi:hypothetical protein
VKEPSRTTIKILFALSGNTCSYTGCENQLTDPSWEGVQAEVAHIRGEREGSARFDAGMTEAERQSFPNLILLCPNDHRRIDNSEQSSHPVELLEDMKAKHEGRASGRHTWATDDQLDRYADMVLAFQRARVHTW